MESLIHSPAFNCVKMAWVAGVGVVRRPEEARADSDEALPAGRMLDVRPEVQPVDSARRRPQRGVQDEHLLEIVRREEDLRPGRRSSPAPAPASQAVY